MSPAPHSESAADGTAAAGVDTWTIARVLAWATQDLERRGLRDSPRLDTELLLGRALGLDRVKLIVDARRPLEPDELSRFRALLVRRRRAEPIAYILGEREFYGLPFRVNRDVLIPRPDTETLVNVALARTEARHLYGRAADLCTGSGCVAIAFAKQRPTWRVTGSDVSPAALSVARRNALSLGAIWNVDFRCSDLLDAIPESPALDLILANPPYVSLADMDALSPDIREHEPHVALYGGRDGLDLLRRLVRAAPARLVRGGVLAVEVGAGQARRVARGLASLGFGDVQIACDYGGIERVVSGALG
jgi:release factor glutamine methyltransferase